MGENKRTIEDKLYVAFSTLDEGMAKYSCSCDLHLSVAFTCNATSFPEIVKMAGRTSDHSILNIHVIMSHLN